MARSPDRDKGDEQGREDDSAGPQDQAQERVQAATLRLEANPQVETVPVVVHPRKTVHYNEQVGTRIHQATGQTVPVYATRVGRPGTVIHVSPADAAFLRAHGFLHDPTDPTAGPATTATVPSALPPQGPTINGEDGTVVRAG